MLNADYRVLTAGHCVDGCSSYHIDVGAHSLATADDNEMEILSTNSILHEDYNPFILSGDIGLIQLGRPIELDDASKDREMKSLYSEFKFRFGGFDCVLLL